MLRISSSETQKPRPVLLKSVIDVFRCGSINREMEESRIRELDGLRAIAVLLVLAWHYIGIPDGPDHWLWKVLNVGRFGVDLFFVLSGYLIAGILLKNRDSQLIFHRFTAGVRFASGRSTT